MNEANMEIRPDTRAHVRNFVGAAFALTVLSIVIKGSVDLLVPVAVAWCTVSVISVPRIRGAGSFVGWNVFLLLFDAVLDVAVMGTHLPAWIPDRALVPWNFDTGQGWTIAYWILLWGIAVPNRTLAMADRATLPPARAIALVVTVIGLHATFVEDVIYFALLGYPPLLSTPPENYAYLPQFFGLGAWTAPKVWVVSAVGSLAFIIASTIAVCLPRQTGELGPENTRDGGLPAVAGPKPKARS